MTWYTGDSCWYEKDYDEFEDWGIYRDKDFADITDYERLIAGKNDEIEIISQEVDDHGTYDVVFELQNIRYSVGCVNRFVDNLESKKLLKESTDAINEYDIPCQVCIHSDSCQVMYNRINGKDIIFCSLWERK
jgi:hypothetical protein